MPMPEGAQLNFGYSPLLTKVGLNLLPSLDQFIGGKIFPTVPVGSPVGTYNIWTAADFLRRNGKVISNYEAVPLGGFSSSQATYSVTNWGLGTPYTNRDLADARRGGMSDQQFKNNKARWVTTQGVLEKEFRVKTLIETTANWTTTIAGVASAPSASQFIQWDQAASTPVDDVIFRKRQMRLLTGFEPNSMVIPETVMISLQKNAQIQDRVKVAWAGAGPDRPVQINYDHIKLLFGLENLWVPKGVYNSAAEGQAATIVDIWAQKQMWLGFVQSTPSFDTPSAGYTFAWTGGAGDGMPGGLTGAGPNNLGSIENDQGLFVREYLDPPRAATIIEGMLWGSPNVVSADLGMTWTAAVA